ncbi:hypothetical protein PACTADRAFT_31707 [Pachysolen tannophilus NRRL Y-2460]|uniref:Signal recognition particle SEC65 subunit n=1 Tax=Pachysolen tannophilus NRRL Y-2460 TaxID=669874 RepID=A0A1E4U335_PACTA|nr:hypothetical protein PACTADRAFT_31707 [Pachysolen tannophilus NRRL Y-2460]
MPTLEEIEDVEDIDDLDMDLAEFDPSLRTPIAPARPQPTVVRSSDNNNEPSLFPQMGNNPMMEKMFSDFQAASAEQSRESQQPQQQKRQTPFTQEQMEEIKRMQIIYPCYFDINRSCKEGRKVNKKYAVSNPLAKTILDACRSMKLICVIEVDKSHPQDFGNPGRVRVLIKEEGDAVYKEKFNNKRRLLELIGEYLVRDENKTTLRKVKDIPPEAISKDLQGYEPELIPKVKGFKMNEIVPLYSPLLIKIPQFKMIYEKEYMEKPKIPVAPPKPKNKYMQVRR